LRYGDSIINLRHPQTFNRPESFRLYQTQSTLIHSEYHSSKPTQNRERQLH
jgi:hypothetical protein